MHQRQHTAALPSVVLGRLDQFRIPPAHTFNFLLHHQLFLHHQTVFQVSEWAVDYNVPGGTDKEGWQYAADFPVYVILICQDVVSKEKSTL